MSNWADYILKVTGTRKISARFVRKYLAMTEMNSILFTISFKFYRNGEIDV